MSDLLQQLGRLLAARKTADPDSSYVASLYHQGLDKILEKVGEEAIEVILAAKNAAEDEQKKASLVHETADLWFHTLVVLAAMDLEPQQVLDELAKRLGVSGLDEKAARLSQ